jgi:ribonuclease-3
MRKGSHSVLLYVYDRMVAEDIISKASALEDFVQYRFNDRELLAAAMVSRGNPNEHPEVVPLTRQPVLSNLGDSVIDLLVTEHLIRERGFRDEGHITVERIRMVRGSKLNELARPILPFILMSNGERNEVEHSRTPGESLEAVVGALYLDGGLLPAKRLLVQLGLFNSDE